MDNDATRNDETERLRRREEELLARIEMLKESMSQTSEMDTLVFKNTLMKQAQEELRRVQEKLTGVARD
jgi:hypothetical protein